jgi:hypothetical protein
MNDTFYSEDFYAEYETLSPENKGIVDAWKVNHLGDTKSIQDILDSFVAVFNSTREFAKFLYGAEIDDRFDRYVDWSSMGLDAVYKTENAYICLVRVYMFR